MKRCSTLLIIREMQIITTRYHLALLSRSLQITNVGKDVEKRGPLYTNGGNVNWSALLENSMAGPKTLKIGLPYDLVIPLLCICPGKKNKKNTNWKRYMYPNVHSNTVYNSQDTGAPQVTISRQIGQEDVAYTPHTHTHTHIHTFTHSQWNITQP